MDRDFEEIYKQYLPKFKTFAKNNRHIIEIDDGIQEQAMVLVECLKKYNGQFSFNTFLWSCIKNRYRNIRRSNNALKRRAEVISIEECRI